MEERTLRSLTPVEALTAIYSRLTQLAGQLEDHADCAPYPYVASRLRQIAREKQNNAASIKQHIERRGGWVTEVSIVPASGKNHWQRMMRDLNDQRELEHFLYLCEPRLTRDSPELVDLLQRLTVSEAAHRAALIQLLAAADPQAPQPHPPMLCRPRLWIARA
jgi:hypothetical protein